MRYMSLLFFLHLKPRQHIVSNYVTQTTSKRLVIALLRAALAASGFIKWESTFWCVGHIQKLGCHGFLPGRSTWLRPQMLPFVSPPSNISHLLRKLLIEVALHKKKQYPAKILYVWEVGDDMVCSFLYEPAPLWPSFSSATTCPE